MTSRTSPELILECVLFDSVDLPNPETESELAKYSMKSRGSTKFNLDLSLAPYKLAILYKRDDEHAKTVAYDLKRMLRMRGINGTLVYAVDNDQDALNARLRTLDILGVPYSLYLPSRVTVDGMCRIRFRETELNQVIHTRDVVKQFRDILDSLNY